MELVDCQVLAFVEYDIFKVVHEAVYAWKVRLVHGEYAGTKLIVKENYNKPERLTETCERKNQAQ